MEPISVPGTSADLRTYCLDHVEAWHDDLREAALNFESHGWRLKDTKDDVEIWTKNDDDSAIKLWKGVGTVDASPYYVEEYLHDVNNLTEIDEMAIAGIEVEIFEDLDCVFQHNKYDSGFVVVKNRDFSLFGHRKRYGPHEYSLVVQSVDHPDIPPCKGFERAVVKGTGFYIQAGADELQSKVTYVVQLDPKGWLPTWIVNIVAVDQPLVVDQIRTAIAARSAVGDDLFVQNPEPFKGSGELSEVVLDLPTPVDAAPGDRGGRADRNERPRRDRGRGRDRSSRRGRRHGRGGHDRRVPMETFSPSDNSTKPLMGDRASPRHAERYSYEDSWHSAQETTEFDRDMLPRESRYGYGGGGYGGGGGGGDDSYTYESYSYDPYADEDYPGGDVESGRRRRHNGGGRGGERNSFSALNEQSIIDLTAQLQTEVDRSTALQGEVTTLSTDLRKMQAQIRSMEAARAREAAASDGCCSKCTIL